MAKVTCRAGMETESAGQRREQSASRGAATLYRLGRSPKLRQLWQNSTPSRGRHSEDTTSRDLRSGTSLGFGSARTAWMRNCYRLLCARPGRAEIGLESADYIT